MTKQLLNKKINRPNENSPKNVFDRSSLFTDASAQEKSSPKRADTTTVRISWSTHERLNALVILLGFQSIDQLVDNLLDSYETTLEPDQNKELRVIEKSLASRRNRKKQKP